MFTNNWDYVLYVYEYDDVSKHRQYINIILTISKHMQYWIICICFNNIKLIPADVFTDE